MEYRGFSIEVHRERFFEQGPADSISRRVKELLVSESKIKLYLFDVELHDTSFIFELRSILEEFIGKRLNKYSKENRLNTNDLAFGDYYGIDVHREESSLIITLYDCCDEISKSVDFDVIHAKTLHSLLSKAIQQTTI